MYTIIFARFPKEHKASELNRFPKLDISIMSHHKNLLEARKYLRQHAIDMVFSLCGSMRSENCWITEANIVQLDDGLSLCQQTCDVIDVYEKKGIISEGYIYNSCYNEQRLLGWFECMYDGMMPPAPPMPIKNKKDDKYDNKITYVNVIDELKYLLENDGIVLRSVADDYEYSSEEEEDDY